MGEAMAPLAVLGPEGVKDALVVLKDLASVACNVSLSKGQLMEMLTSVAGTFAFDAATCAATMGTGAALHAVQFPASVTVGVSSVVRGAKMAKGLVGIPHFFGEMLSVEKLDAYVMRVSDRGRTIADPYRTEGESREIGAHDGRS